jgi:hypothetical protein
MSLFGHEPGHSTEQSSNSVKMPGTPADDEAFEASEKAFERLEHPETVGKVVIHGAEKAMDNSVLEFAQPDSQTPSPQPVDSDHQQTA